MQTFRTSTTQPDELASAASSVDHSAGTDDAHADDPPDRTAGADDAHADDPADQTVQSTFESRPSKSVADFQAVVTVSPATSAATSELEAKLQERMLKCEGMDVLHKPHIKRARDKRPSPAPAPARLKQSVLKTSAEMKDVFKADQAQTKVDELVRTASYQRCTKLRTQSAHSLTRGKKKTSSICSPEPSSKVTRRPRSDQGSRAPPRPPSESSDCGSTADVEQVAAEVTIAEQDRVQPAPEVAPEADTSLSALGSPRSESLQTPRSDDERLSFTSVTSQYEFFEPVETGGDDAKTSEEEAATPEPSTHTDTIEESKSPRMFDLEDGDGKDLRTGGPEDVSVEECLLDLVNHIPPRFARRLGSLFQKLEDAKQGQKASNQEEPEVFFEADPAAGKEATPEATLNPPTVASRDPEEEPLAQPKVQQQASLVPEVAPPSPPPTDFHESTQQAEQQQQTFKERQEQLEHQLREDAASMALEVRVLREELISSRERSSRLMELGHEAEARVEAHSSLVGGELESLCAAVANADSKLLEVGVRFEITEKQSNTLRFKSLSAETELKTLGQRLDDMNCQAQQCRRDLTVEACSIEEAEQRIRCEQVDEAARHEEEQAELAAKFTSICEEAEGAMSARAELEGLGVHLKEVVEQLQEAQRFKAQLQAEAASVRERDRLWEEHLRAKLDGAEADAHRRDTLREEHLRAKLAGAEADAERRCRERERAQLEIEAMLTAASEAASLHRNLQEERVEMQELQQETQTCVFALQNETASATCEIQTLRRHIVVCDAAHDRGHAGTLNCELARATQERDEACKDILQKREQLLELRKRGALLDHENEELRVSQKVSRKASVEECEAQVLILRDACEAHTVKRHFEATLKAEARELREEKVLLEQMETEQASAVLRTAELMERLDQADLALHKEEARKEGAAEKLAASCEDLLRLEDQVLLECARVQQERESCDCAESEFSSLTTGNEALMGELSFALQEVGRSRDQEVYLGAQFDALQTTLAHEQQQLREEQDCRHALQSEAEELQGCCSELEARLGAARKQVRKAKPAGSDVGWWSMSTDIRGKGDVQTLREELMAERQQLANHTERALKYQTVCRAVEVEEAAQEHAVKLKDSLRKQLWYKPKAMEMPTPDETAGLRCEMDTPTPALSEELKEVEEEGKIRREQLEAETSLMAMEVVTLTRGLGGRLLEPFSVDGGLFGLRTPLTVHDIRFRLGAVNRTRIVRACPQISLNPGKVPGKVLHGPGTGSKPRGSHTS